MRGEILMVVRGILKQIVVDGREYHIVSLTNLVGCPLRGIYRNGVGAGNCGGMAF